MALNLNLPSLNRKEVMDVSRGQNFFPYELTGNHREAVLDYRWNPPSKENQNRASFRGKVRILESDNKLAVGREYLLNFKVGRPGEQQDYSDRDRRAFIAACMGQRADDPAFDADAAQQVLLDQAEKNGFAAGPDGVYPCQIFHTRTSKSKEKAAIKEGKPVIETVLYANDFFNPVE